MTATDKLIEFLASHEHTLYREEVDLSPLIDRLNFSTPIQLKLSNPNAITHMGTVIVINLCKYNNRFPLFGLRELLKIIRMDVSMVDVLLQQIMLIHLTKMNTESMAKAKMIGMLIDITTDIRFDEQLQDWATVACETAMNSNLRQTIDECMVATFGSHIADEVSKTSKAAVEVCFFDSELTELRGFSGFNIVYINKRHFDEKALTMDSNLILVDIATVVVHELAHVRIRMVLDDLNMSTPIMTATGVQIDDPEFGRIVERAVFGLSVDWKYTSRKGDVPAGYIQDFLKSIHENETLPVVPHNAVLHQRTNSIKFFDGGGVDITLEGIFQ